MSEGHLFRGGDEKGQQPAELRLAGADNGDFGESLRRNDAAAEQRAQARLRQNDFVPPSGESASPSKRAEAVVSDLVQTAKFGMSIHDQGMLRDPDWMPKNYTDRVEVATADIDRKEHDIAQKRWDSLDPARQQAIIKEQESLQFKLLSQRSAEPTPNLDAFRGALEKEFKPLEARRDQIQHDIFNTLSDSDKLGIYRQQEQRKAVKFL